MDKRDLAQDTLRAAIEFVPSLIGLSKSTAPLALDGSLLYHRKFRNLIEGIITLTDSITTARKALEIESPSQVAPLESKMIWLLKDLIQSQESRNQLQMAQLLGNELPTHLEEWQKTGIPALISVLQSPDSARPDAP